MKLLCRITSYNVCYTKLLRYVDETTDTKTVTNTEDVKAKILADITEGTKLPVNMGAIGKFNKTVSQVILAQAMMQMNHDYAGALTLLNEAKNGKKPDGSAIGLAPTYGEIFDIVRITSYNVCYTKLLRLNYHLLNTGQYKWLQSRFC